MNFWIIKIGALGLYVGLNIINSSLYKHFAFIKMTALKSLFIISGHLCNHCKNNEFSLTFLNEWLIGNRCPRVILTWKVSLRDNNTRNGLLSKYYMPHEFYFATLTDNLDSEISKIKISHLKSFLKIVSTIFKSSFESSWSETNHSIRVFRSRSKLSL